MNDIVLDHVAIAVTNLEEIEQVYCDLGFEFGDREVVDSQGVKTSFAKIDKNSKIELLEAVCDDSAIAKFLKKKGQGIHHLCFKVSNLEDKVKELKTKGYKFIYQKSQIGAHQKLVNFIHPKCSGGVLIELCQNN